MRSYVASLALLLVACSSGLLPGTPDGSAADAEWSSGLGELCANGMDDDGDGAIDCADLECAAPPLDEHGDFASANRYVFAGSSACPGLRQTGLVEGALDEQRFAIVRGRVLDRDTGSTLAGARVFVEGEPDLGETRTRADGLFDLAVNAGTAVLVSVTLKGYVPVQRALAVPALDHTWAGELALTRVDGASTTIRFGADLIQVHQGSVVTDDDGSRRATLVFPRGVDATVRASDGTTRAPAELTLRATELTVGARGPDAMPGLLPAASAYTYAVEVSADEVDMQTESIALSAQASLFVDNFLHFPVGTIAPLGAYDRQIGTWVAEPDGFVVRIVGASEGRVLVDSDGDGVEDGAVPASAREGLFGRYPIGAELMWAQVEHFTPHDINWPFGPPSGARPPSARARARRDCTRRGSIIECDTQVLGEVIPLVGGGTALAYASSRVPGRRPAQRIEVSTDVGDDISGIVREIRVTVDVAGQHIGPIVFAPEPLGMVRLVEWDGRDAAGREVLGTAIATVTVSYAYDASYRAPGTVGGFSFGEPGTELSVDVSLRAPIELRRRYEVRVGILDARRHGLGGWTLVGHHFYDRRSRSLWLGTGEIRDLRTVGTRVRFSSGLRGGYLLPLAEGGYLASLGGTIVRRVRDVETPFAGGSEVSLSSGDEGPATSATFSTSVGPMARGADGSVYVTDTGSVFGGGSCVRRIDPGGVIHAFAGRCADFSGAAGDGGPAVNATFGLITAIAVLPDGSVAIADFFHHTIRRVRPDGVIERFAGGGSGYRDGALAIDARFENIGALATDVDGSLIVGDQTRLTRIVRSSRGYVVRGIAGGADAGFEGDGGSAVSARLDGVSSIAVMPGGEICFADLRNARVRCIVANGRGIDTVAGGGTTPITDPGYLIGVTAYSASLPGIACIAPAGDGGLFISVGANLLQTSALFFLRPDGLTQVPSQDGSVLYLFDGSGRHVRTVDSLLGRALLTFAYDAADRLASVTDDDGHVLTITHDGSGAPTSIIGPFGHTHRLSVDADGWLRAVTDPLEATWTLTTDPDGLLRSFTTLDGAESTFEYSAGRLIADHGPEGATTALHRDVTRLGANVTVTGPRPGQREVYGSAAGAGPEDDHSIESSGAGVVQSTVEAGERTHITLPTGTQIWETPAADPRLGPAAAFVTSREVQLPSGRHWSTYERRTVDADDDAETATLPRAEVRVGADGHELVSVWDPTARTLTTTLPSGLRAVTALDERGRTVEERAPGLASVTYEYDSDGFLAFVRQGTGASQRVWSYTYADGSLATATDPLMRTTRWARDDASRPISVTSDDGRTLGIGYDPMDRPISITPPSRSAYGFSYSALGVEETATPPAGGDPASARTISHDLEGAPDIRTEAAGVTVDYDRSDLNGRLDQVVLGRGRFTNQFSAAGLLEASLAPDGQRIAYEYDGEAVEALHITGGPVPADIDFEYDRSSPNLLAWSVGGVRVPVTRDGDGAPRTLGDLVLSRSATTGAVTGTTLGSVQSTYGYTELNEPDTRAFTTGATSLYDFAVLSHDALGRMTRVRETVEGVAHTYDYHFDVADRLDEVRRDGTIVETYTYHPNGARTGFTREGVSGTAVTSVDERLSSHGEETFEYRADGATLARTSPAGRTEYGYDEVGSLESVTLPTGVRVEYVIDPLGSRVGRRVDGVLERGWVFGVGLTPVAEADATGAITSVFVHGPTSLSAPEMMIRGGESYRFVTDVRGSVRLVVRASDGAVVQAIDYDTFGRVTRDTSPGFQPFGFAGGVYDPDTHLVRFGARDYDAETGRFLTPDPSGFAGSLNPYDYAGADPVNAIDPDGEIVFVFMLAVTAAYGFAAADSLWQWGMHRVHPFSCAGRRRFVEQAFFALLTEAVTAGLGEAFLLTRPAGRLLEAEAELAGAGRGGRSVGAAGGGGGAARSFFEGTRYTPKVLQQMRGGVGEFHSFPESVTAFESAGTVRPITGGDGVARQMLEIPGSYATSRGTVMDGVFQFIKEADGAINHRLFVPRTP